MVLCFWNRRFRKRLFFETELYLITLKMHDGKVMEKSVKNSQKTGHKVVHIVTLLLNRLFALMMGMAISLYQEAVVSSISVQPKASKNVRKLENASSSGNSP